jgi:hypothetical protein
MLKLLQEASTLSLADVKKAMTKDKYASLIFKKDLTIDKIDNLDSFLASIKYYLLNNDNVKAFIQSRSNVKDLSSMYLTALRKMRGSELNQIGLDHLGQFVSDLFKEHNIVAKGAMSAPLKKELSKWVNNNGSYFNIAHWAQRELLSLPSIRPKKKTVLYRGVLFSEYALTSRTNTYNGTLEEGNGAKFLKSVRSNNRTVDLEWDRASSWTTDINVAENFAKYGSASSQFGAMIQWLGRCKQDKFIDGALGYVISTFADPDDILIDMNMLSASINAAHGDESEIILKAGEYLCRIVKKYTVTGEVNPDEVISNEDHSKVTAAISAIAKFHSRFKIPDESDSKLEITHYSMLIVRDKNFRKMITNGTTTSVIHNLDLMADFYNEHLSDLTKEMLMPDKFTDTDMAAKASEIASIIKSFRANLDSKDTAKLTGEMLRNSVQPSDILYFEKDLIGRGKIISSTAAIAFEKLADVVGVSLPAKHVVQRTGEAKQQEYINAVTKAFYKFIDVEQPDDRHESIKTMVNLIRKGYRNSSGLELINKIYSKMGKINV